MITALGWGALAASSLAIGALLGIARAWSDRTIGLVLAFGAGALISAVSFELAAEGFRIGGGLPLAIGLAAGALTYFAADHAIARMGAGRASKRRSGQSQAANALALGAFLDGVPEQLVLGLGLAGGEPASAGLLGAIFVSNLPEAVGSAGGMRSTGHSRAAIVRLWGGVAAVCAVATVGGYLLADSASGDLQAVLNGFAAGALLVLLVDSMIPEATRRAGRVAGLVTVLGFAAAAGLSAAG